PDDHAREAGQDRGQGGDARQVSRLPAGRSGGPAPALLAASGADRPPLPGPRGGLGLAAPDHGGGGGGRGALGGRRGARAGGGGRWWGGGGGGGGWGKGKRLVQRGQPSTERIQAGFGWGKSLPPHLPGVRISRWCRSRGPGGGPAGEDRLIKAYARGADHLGK